jgi:hypothetical protein
MGKIDATLKLKKDQFETEWAQARQVFHHFQTEDPARRVLVLGRLFEVLTPWLDRGIRTTVLRHFLLLPNEMVLARFFARAARRDTLHESYQAFLMWVESGILADLADSNDMLGCTNGAPGEPPAELQRKFNQLPHSDRALLYLYMIEGFDMKKVVRFTGIPSLTAASALDRIWLALGIDELKNVPKEWKAAFARKAKRTDV